MDKILFKTKMIWENHNNIKIEGTILCQHFFYFNFFISYILIAKFNQFFSKGGVE